MTKSQLRAWMKQYPFVPFEIALENGDRYVIRHPEAMLLGNGEIFIHTHQNEFVWVKVRKITALKRHKPR